jgi:hypothetical protein
MADNPDTPNKVIRLVDFLNRADPVLDAKRDMETAETDAAYDRAADRFAFGRATTLNGVQNGVKSEPEPPRHWA